MTIKLLRFLNFLRWQFTVNNPPVYEYRVWKGNVNDLLLIFFVITPLLGVGVVVLICYLVGPYGFNPKPLP